MKIPIYKKWWFWLIVVVVIAGGIGSIGDDDTQEVLATQAPTQAPTEAPTITPTETPTQAPTDEVILIPPELILPILEESYEGIATIDYSAETETFSITPTDPAFVSDILAVQTGDIDAIIEWNNLVANTCELSETISGYIISIVNPLNTENALLLVYDGMVLYDFTNN